MAWKCDATYHLRHGGLMLAVYDKIGAITWDSETKTYRDFKATGASLARFYGTESDHTTGCLKRLFEMGWLAKVAEGTFGRMTPIILDASNGKGKNNLLKHYRYVTHDEWAQSHPGQCYHG